MNVYVVLHEDSLDGSTYIRGVYATEAMARDAVTMDEVTAVGMRWTHHQYCCGVVEWVIAETLPEVYHGPEKPYMGEALRGVIVPQAVYEDLLRKTPYLSEKA